MSKRTLVEAISSDKTSFDESSSSEASNDDPKTKTEDELFWEKHFGIGGPKVFECEYCSQRDKSGSEIANEKLAVDDSILTNETQLLGKQKYTFGLAKAVALYKVPTVLVALITGYLYPDCATDEELRECIGGTEHFYVQLIRCFEEDKLYLDAYYTLAIKLKTPTEKWNEKMLGMRVRYGRHRTRDLAAILRRYDSLSLWRAILCDLPQSEVVKFLMEHVDFLWKCFKDVRKIALMKRLVNDLDDWLKIVLNRRGPGFPAIMKPMTRDIGCDYGELIPALLPNDSFLHNLNFWKEMNGQFEDDEENTGILYLRELLGIAGLSCGISHKEFRAIVCPLVYNAI